MWYLRFSPGAKEIENVDDIGSRPRDRCFGHGVPDLLNVYARRKEREMNAVLIVSLVLSLLLLGYLLVVMFFPEKF
jgi:K+-transporting ATPase KdpF subunit